MSSILHPRPLSFKFYKHSMKFVAALSVVGEWPPPPPCRGPQPGLALLSPSFLPSSARHRLQRCYPPPQPGEPGGLWGDPRPSQAGPRP